MVTSTEIDLTVSYSNALSDNVSYTIGAIHYAFPAGVGDSTNEAFLSLSGDLGGITPSITAYYDIDDIRGLYVRTALDKGWQVSEEVTFDAGIGLAFSDTDHSMLYYGVSESGMADAGANAAFTWAIDEHRSLTLFAAGTIIVDKDLEDSLELQELDPENLWGGISYGWNF